MSEFEFLKNAFSRLADAERIEREMKKSPPKRCTECNRTVKEPCNYVACPMVGLVGERDAMWMAKIAALRSEQPSTCRDDGRCQYAIDHGAEGLGHCPKGKCCMPAEAEQQAPAITEQAPRNAFHDQAWELYRVKAATDSMLKQLSAHQFRAIINALYDAKGSQ